jgi:hypothetical protein
MVLAALQAHRLFLKCANSAFKIKEVAYLGHVILTASMALDEQKVCMMLDWPLPKSARTVHAFLALVGYYRRFIHDYSSIVVPLTRLLHKEGFCWCAEVEAAFRALQRALTMELVHQLSTFNREFVVERDTSEARFGVVQHQGDEPVALFSKPIAPCHAKLTAYEREMIRLVQVVKHWRPYLWGTPFFIRIDHYSLKFLLDQKLATIPQHQWTSKLLGFDFRVEYKPNAANVVTDALSRHDTTDDGYLYGLSVPTFMLFD